VKCHEGKTKGTVQPPDMRHNERVTTPHFGQANRVVIIGGGPGGYEAALVAAQLGAKVTVVDSDGLGGSAVVTDCVPSKTLIATAELMTDLSGAPELGVSFEDHEGDAAQEVVVDLARINERVKKHLELKKAVSGIVYLRNKLSAELEEKEREMRDVMNQLPVALEDGEDEVALILIQRGFVQQVEHADDSAQRSADLVVQAGQKGALDLIQLVAERVCVATELWSEIRCSNHGSYVDYHAES